MVSWVYSKLLKGALSHPSYQRIYSRVYKFGIGIRFFNLKFRKNQNNGEEIVNYFNSKHYKATFKK
ncbi:hypothetical protein JUNP499_2556 [Acinetobacter baumannii]